MTCGWNSSRRKERAEGREAPEGRKKDKTVPFEVERKEVFRIVPEGRKEGKNPVRRVRGKLSKKELKEMKSKHRDVAGMMAQQPPQEVRNYEKRVFKEIEEMERIDEERKERLERLRRRKLEWNARRAQKTNCELEQSSKNINASGKSMEDRSIHILTVSESNNVL